MAEAAMFSFASKILSTITSSTFEKAFERACSIRNARDELHKLRITIQTIQAVLLDAEKKQERSVVVKDWITRVKDVLYDADDLFDEVATNDMLRDDIKSNKLLKKVRVSCSKLNPIVSNNSIAMKVKAIRKSFLEISIDMASLGFVSCDKEGETSSGMRRGQDLGSFVDSKNVIGRDEDKKVILEMIFRESDNPKLDAPLVVSVVGIGGMGKTTLAQLVYNDDQVKDKFEYRWFACISNTSNDKEVLGKIFQSMCGEKCSDFTVSQLQDNIRELAKDKRFLLVLDDVWDEGRGNWQDRMSLLKVCAKGSKIIVTTRSLSVARVVGSFYTHKLDGLSEEDSWNLFKGFAFTPEQENDERWCDLGRQILKKCANVPLAIRSIANLLYTKTTIQEWESFINEEIPKLGHNEKNPIMPVLKLSYDHLHSDLKQCFAYCSLFPKDYVIFKQDLIYLWISQGYIKPNNETQTAEEVGHSYFMYLLRRSFFQLDSTDYRNGDVETCKMHDLIHDLAQYVAGEESIILTSSSSNKTIYTRHASVGHAIDDSWAIPERLLKVNRLRSFMFMEGGSIRSPALDQQLTYSKLLRTLSLHKFKVESLPSSIGELKHLRYLDLSKTTLQKLPDSITKLLNLQRLNITLCKQLQTLPNDFRKLVNLRRLDIMGCEQLTNMPPRFEELASLQYLDEFRVGRGTSGIQRSQLDAVLGLKLTGTLTILFEDDTDDWDGVEC